MTAPTVIPPESVSERYLRHIRNSVVILATLALLSVAGGVIVWAYAAYQAQQAACQQNYSC
jgi:hypothetical protein